MSEKLIKALNGDTVYVIAEVGTNHGCDLDQALSLIDACAAAGADAVKFQSWKLEDFQNPIDPGADGAGEEPSGAYPILGRYQLPDAWHGALAARCRERGVDFLSTPFDVERVSFLAAHGVAAIKISSSDLTYPELLEAAAGAGLPVILSTGMADMREVEEAVKLLAGRVPCAVLHCVAGYPPDAGDANLAAIPALKNHLGLAVGWSDHYEEDVQAIAAVALGATFLEKHVTLSRANPDPDSPFATTPEELAALVRRLAVVRAGLGDGVKRCAASEKNGLIFGRRGVYAVRDLEAGETLGREMLKIVRPARGDFAPGDVPGLIGRVLAKPIARHRPISRDAFA